MRPGAYYRSLVAEHLGIRPGAGWTLDLGAGDGSVFDGARVVALDTAARRGFVRGDGTALPFHRGSFETVLALDVLEHVVDDGGCLSEIARVSAGTAWVSVPSKDLRLLLTGVAHRAWGHVRPGYSRGEVAGWGTPIAWNEPGYRALYPAIRVLGWVAPALARSLIRAAFKFDKGHAEGDRGHYFCRIK